MKKIKTVTSIRKEKQVPVAIGDLRRILPGLTGRLRAYSYTHELKK